ncbi:MAG: hypothetical protein JKY99_06200 [Rhizobiales bacterium]|nr:hypothetical protein [Hyphomicrobiales bacterium]
MPIILARAPDAAIDAFEDAQKVGPQATSPRRILMLVVKRWGSGILEGLGVDVYAPRASSQDLILGSS